MDGYEATKIVYQRIQALDPENASKIMGVLLIQDQGEKEMIRLAFGPETLLHSLILKAKKELFLPSTNTPSTPVSPSPVSPFCNPLSLSRQSSLSSSTSSRFFGTANLPSPLSVVGTNNTSSWSNSSSTCFSDLQTPDEVDLIDELHLQDQLSFLNDGSEAFGPKNADIYSSSPIGDDAGFFPYHRRSSSVSDICMGSDDLSGGFGWKPCLYYARGYCKNGTNCRFLHGEGGFEGGGSPSKVDMLDQHFQELMRSKSAHQQRLAVNANFPYSSLPTNKCMNFLLQQQLQVESPSCLRGMMIGDGMNKFSRNRLERGDFGVNGLNPGSRQIYLTFPADSTFREEDVSNYFSLFGPVQDVRIPYQQKRMFGFVTFEFPETVKVILAKGNPHFVCDARVLVKPYKEKGKIPEKYRRHQQQMERGEFPGCGSPTGLHSKDPYDNIHLGARLFYNSHDMLLRRKLEEQTDLQQAIELQNRRLMGLQFLDVKRNNHHRTHSTGAVVSSPTYSPTFMNQNMVFPGECGSPEAKEENGSLGTVPNPANVATEKDVVDKDRDIFVKDDNVKGKQSPAKENEFQESFEHNLPDSPFASPKAAGDYVTAFSNDNLGADKETGVVFSPPSATNNNLITGSSLFSATTPIEMAPYKACHFQIPRFASGHETVGI